MFYWSSAFRICTGYLPKYEWNLFKIGSKNTYFPVFQGFPETIATHLAKTAKMAKTVKIIKKVLGTFFSRLQALSMCKVSEKSNERFPRKSVTHERTYVRTNERDS